MLEMATFKGSAFGKTKLLWQKLDRSKEPLSISKAANQKLNDTTDIKLANIRGKMKG